MPLNPINVGTSANNGTGDPLRLAFQKSNANSTYLKTYIDNLLQGLKWKQRVEVATTGNITLSGEQTIDGVLTNVSRVLVKDQTNKAENGIYISGAIWIRSEDADAGEELVNATVSVVSGTENANTNWTCNAESITLGTTNIEFVRFEGADGVDQGTFDAAIQLINDTIDDLTARVQAIEDNPSGYTLTAQAITDALGGAPAMDSEVVKSVTAGTNVTIDNTDPQNPIISASGGTGTAVERTIKEVSNTSQYTLVAADFTDFRLVFTANAGETINVILNAGVAPLKGSLEIVSKGNHFLVPTAGAGVGEPTYEVVMTSPTEGQTYTEGDTITLSSTVTETPASGSVTFKFDDDVNPITTGDNSWIGAVALDTDFISWKGTFESNVDDVAYTQAEKTKLAGIATGATANDTDANLKNRANHTGTQLASTISDFNTAVANAGLKEHQINGTRIDNANVSGTYELDYNAASLWVLTLVGATTLTEANIPTGSNTKPIELEINGNFALNVPARWVKKPSSDSYLGTVKNSFLISSHTATRATYSLENLS